jgi:hypothetical protein
MDHPFYGSRFYYINVPFNYILWGGGASNGVWRGGTILTMMTIEMEYRTSCGNCVESTEDGYRKLMGQSTTPLF